MKALTVRQPWAFAIAALGKSVENRTWNTHYRGLLAIHAGSRWDSDEAVRRVGELTGVTIVTTDTAAIVAVVDLVSVHNSATCIRPVEERHEHDDGPFTCSRWAIGSRVDNGMHHWVLGTRRQLAYPIACKGRQGLWDLPAYVEADVLAQISTTAGLRYGSPSDLINPEETP
ncbi:hypothetical protein ABGB18_11335 [Nonomuraea sp. B12E4]|uniref:hypothetical protein n=1 Tax=Nonomuraea sp. B12E4 TaxID=3153564 RepID=UPI00325D5DAA